MSAGKCAATEKDLDPKVAYCECAIYDTDRGLVPKDHQQEMAYVGESNGHVADDVT